MIIVASKVESGGRGEDRLAIERQAARVLVVVADGAGGMSCGAQAAQSVCDAVVAAFRDRISEMGVWDARLGQIDAMLASVVRGGMSTAVVAEIVDGQVAGASVGDSGAWLVSSSGVIDLTERQWRKPLLGSGVARPVAFGPVPMLGRLLIATDGLFKYAERARLASATVQGTVESAVETLVEAVRMKNGKCQDDVDVVVCEETP